jgi:hypothetical protein
MNIVTMTNMFFMSIAMSSCFDQWQ